MGLAGRRADHPETTGLTECRHWKILIVASQISVSHQQILNIYLAGQMTNYTTCTLALTSPIQLGHSNLTMKHLLQEPFRQAPAIYFRCG